MSFLRCLIRLSRLFLGLPAGRSNDHVQSVHLGLFDHLPVLKWLASSYFFHRFKRLLPPPSKARTHAFVVGRSGSGKSELLKLLALADKTKRTWTGKRIPRRDQTLILIDPHGDLALQFAQQRLFQANDHSNLIYLDPCMALGRGLSPVLNPFELYGHQHSDLERGKAVQQLTSVFRSLTCKQDESLSTNMETLLYPCLSVLLSRPGSTLFDFLRFVHSSGNDDLLQLGRQSENEAHRYFFRHSFNDPRFRPTRGAVSTKIQSLLNSKAFASFMAQPKSSLDLASAVNNGKTIILNCSASHLGAQTMSAMGRFFVGMVLAIALNRPKHLRFLCPIRLILDEMHHFVSGELSTILNEARKYGLHLTLACQIVGQGMSPQLNKAILGNTALKILGDAGADSRRVMTKEMNIKSVNAEVLDVGQFVLRHGHWPSVRFRCTNAHVGSGQTMSPSQWRALKQDQIKRWYIRSSKPDPPDDQKRQEPVLPNTFHDFIP